VADALEKGLSMNTRIPLIPILFAILVATISQADAQTLSTGGFQFDGSYYFYDSANNQYCDYAVAPVGASSLPVFDPQSLSALNVGMCNGAAAPLAYFQFNGNYYFNYPPNNQYCVLATAPANASSLLVLNPQYLTALNIGMCNGAMAPLESFQFNGNYYFNYPPDNQYCVLATAPANASSLVVLNPQYLTTLNIGMCNGAAAPLGSFQFNGSYYFNNPANNQYCVMATAPANASSLMVLSPQYLTTLNIGMCNGAAAPLGSFQFNGLYYFNYPAGDQFCVETTTPANSSGLPFINPIYISTINRGNCDSGANAPMAYTGYNLGSAFAVSTNANWQIFNAGYFPSHNLFIDAQQGNDSNLGTAALPLQSISAGQSLVRKLQAANNGPIQVNLRGTFYLQQPLSFTAADSGQGSNFVVYRNWSGYTATISGGTPIAGSAWTLYNSAMNIYRAPIGTMVFHNLYVNNQRANLAKTQFPLTGSVVSSAASAGHVDCSQCGIPLPVSSANVEIVTLSMYSSTLCPGQLDVHGGLTMADLTAGPNPSSWCWSAMLSLPEYTNLNPPHITWLQNSSLFLTNPGDWALDKSAGFAYYIPRPGEVLNQSAIVAPRLTQLLQATSLSNVAFIGITFSHTDWQGTSGASGYETLQADELLAPAQIEIPAAVSLEGCQNILMSESQFEHLGTAGIFVGIGSNSNLIFHNSFSDISASAIQIAGVLNQAGATSNPTKFTTIQDNSISFTGREYFGSPAIFQGYAESSVLDHNQIHDTPYTGISDGWGWTTTASNNVSSTISSNLIYNGMQVLQDGGGIYTNSAQAGTTITLNYVHDLATGLPGVHDRVMSIGIYLDNGSSYIDVASNSIQNIPLSSVGEQPCGVFQNGPNIQNQITCSTPANAINPLAGPRPIQPPQ
jgi:hypothetical protein